MCSGELSDSKVPSSFNLRKQITEVLAIPPVSSFLKREKFAPPYTPPNSARNFLSDRLWAPLLYVSTSTKFLRFCNLTYVMVAVGIVQNSCINPNVLQSWFKAGDYNPDLLALANRENHRFEF